MLIDVAIVGVLVAALATGRVSATRAFIAFLAAVVVLGRVPFERVLPLVADPALVAVVCLVLFSGVFGRIGSLRRSLFAVGAKRPLRAVLARFLGITAAVSSVVPNTAVVGAFMGPAAAHPRVPAHQLLLPLSYTALAGGMLTPFGTSANLIVAGQAGQAGIALGLAEFLPVGLTAVTLVVAALLITSPVILGPRTGAADVDDDASAPEFFHVEASIGPGSTLAGRTVSENKLRALGRFFLAEVLRGDRALSPVEPDEVLLEGDVLVFVGDVRFIDELEALPGLSVSERGSKRAGANILHAVVAAGSNLSGATLKSARFRARFDASVFAVRRGATRLSGKLGEIRLAAGDLLVVSAGPDFAARADLRGELHVVEVDDPGRPPLTPLGTLGVVGGFGAFLAAAFSGVDFALAALLLVAWTMAGGWLIGRDVKRDFPFELVVILWGSLTLGTLIASSGLASAAASALVSISPGASPVALLVFVFLMTWGLTEMLSNASAALAALPVGLEVAGIAGAEPAAFAMAVALGASASFLVPFGYQTHLMVMGPGRYVFSDFLKLGSVALAAYAVGGLTAIALVHL